MKKKITRDYLKVQIPTYVRSTFSVPRVKDFILIQFTHQYSHSTQLNIKANKYSLREGFKSCYLRYRRNRQTVAYILFGKLIFKNQKNIQNHLVFNLPV